MCINPLFLIIQIYIKGTVIAIIKIYVIYLLLYYHDYYFYIIMFQNILIFEYLVHFYYVCISLWICNIIVKYFM